MISKRTLTRGLTVLAGLSLAAGAFAQSGTETGLERVQRTKTLRVGVVSGAIPYFHKDLVTQKWQGFGPDFSESLAKHLGAKVQIVETTWGNAVMDLQANKIDAMFGMAPTPARREMVDFSNTLFNNTFTVVCKKGFPAVKTWEQLNNPQTKIVVDVGSNQDQLATRLLTKANVSRLESSGAATMAVQTGRADCQVLVVLLAQPLLAKRADIGTMSIPAPVETSSVNIGIRKETDKGFEKAVNAWLQETRAKDEVRSVILHNMDKLAGVKPESFPAEVKF